MYLDLRGGDLLFCLKEHGFLIHFYYQQLVGENKETSTLLQLLYLTKVNSGADLLQEV
jgi:hypothetical protein